MPDEIELFEAIYSQRAIRKLKPDPVSDELVHQLIEAATKAPSGGNREPWAFLVVRGEASKKKIGEWYLDAWNRTYGQIDAEGGQLPDSMTRVYGAAEHLAHHLERVAGDDLRLPARCAACGQPPRRRSLRLYLPGRAEPAAGRAWTGLGASLTTLHKGPRTRSEGATRHSGDG